MDGLGPLHGASLDLLVGPADLNLGVIELFQSKGPFASELPQAGLKNLQFGRIGRVTAQTIQQAFIVAAPGLAPATDLAIFERHAPMQAPGRKVPQGWSKTMPPQMGNLPNLDALSA